MQFDIESLKILKDFTKFLNVNLFHLVILDGIAFSFKWNKKSQVLYRDEGRGGKEEESKLEQQKFHLHFWNTIGCKILFWNTFFNL